MEAMTIEKPLEPAIQIRQCIISHLRARAQDFSLPVLPEQIRGQLDVSGAPKGAWGVIVSADDLGDHAGNTGRILVDIRPRIAIYSHLDEDADGTICDRVATDVMTIMDEIQYDMQGWMVVWNGNWTLTDSAISDTFRQKIMTATIPIVKQ